MATHKDEFAAANQHATALFVKIPKAAADHYNRRDGRIVIELSSGISIVFGLDHAQGLDQAKPGQLAKIESSPSGLGLYFPALDADIHLPSIFEGFLGSRRRMAAQRGRARVRSRSSTKTAAARANDKRWGGPRKPLSRMSLKEMS